jgi:sulfite exporter TauE/SafE
MNQIFLAFITGLTTGGISCLAVQGGLLASVLTDSNSKTKNTFLFLLSKLISYTILGAILGSIGSKFTFSPTLQGYLQIAIGIFMIATAGRLLNLHPIFRYTVIQPPTFVLRYLNKISKDSSIFAPILLGALTILIPCGVTQAMMVLAIGTGSSLFGSLIMFAFVLGTSPVFFLLGLTVSSVFKNPILSKIAAIVIIIIGLIAINTGQILRGSVHTFQNYSKVLFESNKKVDNSGNGLAKVVNGVQEATIEVSNYAYKTNVTSLKIGIPVKLTMVTKNVQSCSRSFVIPSMNINKILPSTGTEIIEFTPNKIGTLTFSCSMGMYTGSFEIIK